MEENKSVIYTKAVDEAGFVYSLSARQDSLADAYEDMQYTLKGNALMPWRETSNILDKPAPKTNNMVDEAKDLGALRFLGVKNLPPTVDQCTIGDAYEVGVSLYTYDTEYLKFWKRLKQGDKMEVCQYPIASIKVGSVSWDEFVQVFPDWDVKVTEGKTDLPMGNQYLYFEVSDRLNTKQNPFHDLKGTRDA